MRVCRQRRFAVAGDAGRVVAPSAVRRILTSLTAFGAPVLSSCGGPPATQAGPLVPNPDEVAIRQARLAQNDAIGAMEWDSVAAVWTEDVTIRAGLGFTLAGREEYRSAFVRDAAILYARTTDNVRVSPRWPLAWESGTWVGRDRTNGAELVSGNYAAQWLRTGDGRWRIRSELFVALRCSGRGCEWPVWN